MAPYTCKIGKIYVPKFRLKIKANEKFICSVLFIQAVWECFVFFQESRQRSCLHLVNNQTSNISKPFQECLQECLKIDSCKMVHFNESVKDRYMNYPHSNKVCKFTVSIKYRSTTLLVKVQVNFWILAVLQIPKAILNSWSLQFHILMFI